MLDWDYEVQEQDFIKKNMRYYIILLSWNLMISTCCWWKQAFILLAFCFEKQNYINRTCLSIGMVFVTGGRAAAGQGGTAQFEGQLLWPWPPTSHPGHPGAGRVQPHGPITLNGHPTQTGQRGTRTLTHTNTIFRSESKKWQHICHMVNESFVFSFFLGGI